MISYENLWKIMQQRGISQYALIKKYHVSPAQITRLKRNESVSTHTIEMFCRILQCRVEDIMEYINGIREHGQVLIDVQEIPHRERAGEYLMTRLRTTMGISAEEYTQKYLLPFLPIETKLESYYETGHTTYINGRWRLTPAGFLISNQILSDLFLAQERAIEQTR